ncbi:hypothetical protein CEXT_547601 [Caerostris extrusa]|uniref:Uncharacterized protein n=1 Tax=Caerostris extrusa TaxID=172846 RepID=A0AAV4N2B8_CAEEX|nr:hypothetical protein CEXT_547601 [Caerostris extrusa]
MRHHVDIFLLGSPPEAFFIFLLVEIQTDGYLILFCASMCASVGCALMNPHALGAESRGRKHHTSHGLKRSHQAFRELRGKALLDRVILTQNKGRYPSFQFY